MIYVSIEERACTVYTVHHTDKSNCGEIGCDLTFSTWINMFKSIENRFIAVHSIVRYKQFAFVGGLANNLI